MLLRISSQSWPCWFWSSRWAPHGYCQWIYRWTQTVQEGWLLRTLAAVHLMEDTEHACSARDPLTLTFFRCSRSILPSYISRHPTRGYLQWDSQFINHYTPHTSCCIHLHIWTECLWYSCTHLQEVYWELFCLVQKLSDCCLWVEFRSSMAVFIRSRSLWYDHNHWAKFIWNMTPRCYDNWWFPAMNIINATHTFTPGGFRLSLFERL